MFSHEMILLSQNVIFRNFECNRDGGTLQVISEFFYTTGFFFLFLIMTEFCNSSSSGDTDWGYSTKHNKIASPLKAIRDNPGYFPDDRRKTIYLTGAQTWASSKDGGIADPPAVYPDSPGCHIHNFICLWTLELTKHCYKKDEILCVTSFPWKRTVHGNAIDFKVKLDLSKRNEEYFKWPRTRVERVMGSRRNDDISVNDENVVSDNSEQ
jgi:hypothetical protein